MKRVIIPIVFVLSVAIGAAAVLNHKTASLVDQKIHLVSLLKTGASPDVVFVKVGEEVQFNAKDNASHNIATGDSNSHQHDSAGTASANPDTRESGRFNAGEAYRVAFRQAGTFLFHDTLNDAIAVTVVAYNPITTPKVK